MGQEQLHPPTQRFFLLVMGESYLALFPTMTLDLPHIASSQDVSADLP